MYSIGISQVAEISNAYKLQQDVEDNTIIRDQMAHLGWSLVYIFSNFHVSFLAAVHTANNLDFRNEDEGYETSRKFSI